ncbi:hypothetical protein Trichorick_00353 [Candidatus Trichorickettsia mobilis]|uniref:Uncharacterized protein n=1 Tax=Candidatus Trichorickettsia mobilis TaxID=1346319 RepID=A0ABZ0UTF4_9RICK|nr:hypothetical protein [Candidatus Trichorickettsia mobilis]WPY00475.1 hypothetical protein Trichorick_00353 [Candidatus Trichorickettsia mobilis]
MTKLLSNNIAIGWLRNGIIALGFAGIYSIVLVILRTPQLAWLIENTAIFKSTLIVHVNLSVLVWLLSVVCIIWSDQIKHIFLGEICLYTALAGTIMITISPFCGSSTPIMNNYIPMLENIIFVIGLSLFGSAVLIFAANNLYEHSSILFRDFYQGTNYETLFLKFAAWSASIIFIAVWHCFVQSYLALRKVIDLVAMELEFYYELLYWSGGHLLQFLFCQILIVVWIVLSSRLWHRETIFTRLYLYLLVLNCVLAITGLMGHHLYDIIDAEFKIYYTNHMRYLGGIVPAMSLILLAYETFTQKIKVSSHSYIAASIICSSLLFLFGGLIGLLIKGVNVSIPAHYHGSIVAITIAFMGFAYFLCITTQKTTDTSLLKKMNYQIYTITLGQALHIGGLAIAGGYGVLRKTPGVELELSAYLAMGMVGIGGIIAIVGGLMFVVICGKNLFYRVPNFKE